MTEVSDGERVGPSVRLSVFGFDNGRRVGALVCSLGESVLSLLDAFLRSSKVG